ncbi:hypothetical protein ACPPVO_54865 [Dactylosporangium sp. McL0621]|uniref:hypothetical protein n=1 Tax=Dactylosporangium sp. McL0621 TaxID=3415678 RepID=UPI003CE714E4
MPPKDAARHAVDDEVVDARYGISPASDEQPAPVPAAALEASAEQWTDTDSHGFQRSRPLHPSGSSDRAVQDASARGGGREQAARDLAARGEAYRAG